MNVILRQRLKGDKISLYLDYYSRGKRQYEYLKLYLVPEPEKGSLTKEQKDSNRKTLALAEAIRSKRHLEIQNGYYGFQDREKVKGSFISYVEHLKDKRNSSIGNYDNWDSTLKHLKKYVKTDVTFEQVNKEWLEGFKDYLSTEAKTPRQKALSQNSQAAYYSKVRAALKQAHKDGIMRTNPSQEVAGIKPGETERSFLTYEELQAMAKEECDFPILKHAFIFSALTGLRWSDIEKLVWSEVEHSKELGYFIRFRQKKTKGAETLPISEQAFKLLGERRKPEHRVFEGLKYSAWHNLKLAQWALRAGVTKHITFHTARHSFATLQLTLGTDIYTVSKMLGHKNLKTTQVYTRIVDHKKQEAANRIKLDL
jgi:integrase